MTHRVASPRLGICHQRGSFHLHDTTKMLVMVNPVLKKLNERGLLGISEARVSNMGLLRLQISFSFIHSACYIRTTCPLAEHIEIAQTHFFSAFLEHIFIFTFMGNDPKVDYHGFFYLVLIFTVLLHLDVCVY